MTTNEYHKLDVLQTQNAALEATLRKIEGVAPLFTATKEDLWLALGEIRSLANRGIQGALQGRIAQDQAFQVPS